MLIVTIFLTSGGQTNARPADALKVYNSDENGSTVDLLAVPVKRGEDDQQIPVLELQRPEYNENNELIEKLEFLKPEVQEKVNSSESERDANTLLSENNTASDRNASNDRNPRSTGNACIIKYIFRVLYNVFFKIPVCKKHCKAKYKIVTFRNGQTKAIRYDCYK